MALTPPQYKQMKQFLESDQRVTLEDGGMLVKPGFGGARQGYATSKVKTKKFKYPFQNQFGTFYSDTKRKPFKSIDMKLLKKIVDEANASDRFYTSEDISKLYAEATGRTNVTTRQTSAGKTVSYSRIPNATINQVGKLLSKEDKVKKVFQEVLAMDDVVPSVDLKVYKGRPIADYKKYIVSKTGVGITNVDKIVKSLPSYKKNEKAFKYLETSRLMKTDLKDMSLSNQLKFANEAAQGKPIFTGVKNINLSDPNYNVMDYALRSWNKTKGEGLIKFFDANNKPIKWGFGKNLPLNKVSFSQGASKQKFGIGRSNNYLNLRLVGKNYFPEVYENQNLINQLKATKVDNPFKPGTKTSFINLMKRVYIKERGYNAKAPLFSIFHGPKGVALEPFTNLSFGMQDLNKAIFDIERSIPLKGLRKKVIDQAYGQLKGKQGEKLLNAIITQQSDIAKDVAMGKPPEGTLRKRALLETAKTQKLGTKEETVLKKLIATLSKDPRCGGRGFKNQGGRIGLQDGSASLDICFRQGVDNINRGLPNPTAAQARNFGRVAALGRNVVKFGVLPEALFVAGESVIRAGMGDTLPEAILRASEYLLPGNQTKIADRMMLARTVGPKTAELILKANELRGFENQIENLENEKQFTGILTDDGFDDNFFGQTKVEEENAIQNRINALQNQKKSYQALTEAQYNFADRKAQEAEDIKKSKALFPKLFAKARSIQPDFDDPLREGVQQTLDLNLEMPNRFQREIDLFYRSPDVQALVNTPDQQLSNLFKGQDLENIKQLKIDTKNQLAETVSEAAAINPEGMFGAQGVFATPLDLGVSYTPPPIDSIDEMEKEIIGQTNVANPFDLDTSSVATGLRGFSAAGGGIAKLAGVPSGPPPSSGPNSQGLQGLLKRVRNR